VHHLKLPDGYDTWAAAWLRGGTVLWLNDKTNLLRINFSNPKEVSEELVEESNVPANVLEALTSAVQQN
jgi:hypothetical protein